MQVSKDVSLRPFNTFHIDAKASWLAQVREEEHLFEVYQSAEYQDIPKIVLGGGSNVLITGAQKRMVLKMEIPGIEILKEDSHHSWIRVGAGEDWHEFVMWSIDHGLSGVENLSLIPGTVGAAPMQNIGAYGVEIKEVFDYLEAFDIENKRIVTFDNKQCRFGYRYSIFKGDLKDKYIITHVVFKLNKHPKYNIEYGALRDTLKQLGYEQLSVRAISNSVIHIRQSKLPDPREIGNAGSFFKNPIIEKDHFDSIAEAFGNVPSYPVSEKWVKIPAAWLIDTAGWKGFRKGEIGVHEKQPLVLVNYGRGNGRDILLLSEEIQKSVQQKFGIKLQREVNVI
jgi:UDP-N-acetylmuramate dehydrogenase